MSLLQGGALQQVRGQRLVRPDGAVGLGTYGAVRVVGMTVPEAKAAIEGHLAAYFAAPEVSVEVVGYNSKVYYVIFDGAGSGQQVTRLPVTGGETVLDAIGQVSGLGAIADDRHIWLARPVASGCTCQVLPVDWKAITECADVGTNYQILPGDRLFVKAYAAVRFDNTFSRVVSPIERVLGFTLLATGAYNTARFINQPINNFGNGNAIR